MATASYLQAPQRGINYQSRTTAQPRQAHTTRGNDSGRQAGAPDRHFGSMTGAWKDWQAGRQAWELSDRWPGEQRKGHTQRHIQDAPRRSDGLALDVSFATSCLLQHMLDGTCLPPSVEHRGCASA